MKPRSDLFGDRHGGGEMKKTTLVILGIGLLVAVGASGAAQGFAEVPPTIGAYTLRGGEWQIGVAMGFTAVPLAYRAATISVAYGITGWLDFGIAVVHGVQPGLFPTYMVYTSQAKLRLSLGEGLDLGIPLGLSFVDYGEGIMFGSVHSGAVASMRMGATLTLHGGATLGIARGGWPYVLPYAIADFDLLPNLKLVGEFGFIPLSATIGMWMRVLPFLDVTLSLNPLAPWFTAGLYLRL
jgi:hypothetical protein